MKNIIELNGYVIMTKENEVLAFDQESSTDIEVYPVDQKWASRYTEESKEDAQRIINCLQNKEKSPWSYYYYGDRPNLLDELRIVEIKQVIEFFE